ncbi:hypothetical protein NDU88_000731 [Pleurodeles waltl]|uniref:Uncharacterized protein n=1 Tax=Pleurodeles waltl TaxID=8319 RepID=A0AAV7M644_PLEWA|nr:hypothetical protein NDU88_000731 [Pleurodeles waltl]
MGLGSRGAPRPAEAARLLHQHRGSQRHREEGRDGGRGGRMKKATRLQTEGNIENVTTNEKVKKRLNRGSKGGVNRRNGEGRRERSVSRAAAELALAVCGAQRGSRAGAHSWEELHKAPAVSAGAGPRPQSPSAGSL